jgi:hypothetical protein
MRSSGSTFLKDAYESIGLFMSDVSDDRFQQVRKPLIPVLPSVRSGSFVILVRDLSLAEGRGKIAICL